MLRFIYKDDLMEDESVVSGSSSVSFVSDTLAAKLLATADRYDLGRLRRMFESHLCYDISVNSAAKTLALADRFHATELKAICLRFAAENLAGRLFWSRMASPSTYLLQKKIAFTFHQSFG